MRKIIEKQLKIGQVDIPSIEIDISCRDEIPQLLLGLQAIYSDRRLREEVFDILQGIIPSHIDTQNGRTGMDLWKILVLGTLRLNCNWDFDKVQEIANNHVKVREFLGHTLYELDQRYALQTIKDNVGLLTPEVLDRINTVVVNKGHQICCGTDKPSLKGRCDSFVVETNVHYPTDIGLLWDAMRKVVTISARHGAELGITEWRQSDYLLREIKKLFNQARRLKRLNSKDKRRRQQREELIKNYHKLYTDKCEVVVNRARQSQAILTEMGIGNVVQMMLIEYFIGHAERQIDHIRRRVLMGEVIAHREKVFSVFQPHTEWINKGKAGVSQELGLKACVLEDQYGYILHHHVMQQQTDDQVAVQMVSEVKRKFATLDSCSFDKGFHSPQNQRELATRLEHVVLPKKGKLSQKRKQLEHSPEFVEARKKHSAVESAINALENHGLDRCPDHGIAGFKRYVALSVLARNLQILGAAIRRKQLQQRRRRERYLATRRLRLEA
jgi:hypothetical protein